MTYLEMVNEVLVRLREDEVTAVSENTYSKLVGKFVNQAKRTVEDAWEWVGLKNTIQATTVSGDYRYSLDGVKERFRLIGVFNDTTDRELIMKDSRWMTEQFNVNGLTGEPLYYDVAGVDETDGDYQIDLYPIPNAVWTININLYKRQADLITDTTETAVPSYPIMLYAYYLSLRERGEDAATLTAEAYRDYEKSLGDAIQFDILRSPKASYDWNDSRNNANPWPGT